MNEKVDALVSKGVPVNEAIACKARLGGPLCVWVIPAVVAWVTLRSLQQRGGLGSAASSEPMR